MVNVSTYARMASAVLKTLFAVKMFLMDAHQQEFAKMDPQKTAIPAQKTPAVHQNGVVKVDSVPTTTDTVVHVDTDPIPKTVVTGNVALRVKFVVPGDRCVRRIRRIAHRCLRMSALKTLVRHVRMAQTVFFQTSVAGAQGHASNRKHFVPTVTHLSVRFVHRGRNARTGVDAVVLIPSLPGSAYR